MVVERRNMIIYIYGGEFALRVLGGVDSGGVFELCELLYFWAFLSSSLPFWLGLPLFVPFVGFVAFSFF
jgi:hypothetical protein